MINSETENEKLNCKLRFNGLCAIFTPPGEQSMTYLCPRRPWGSGNDGRPHDFHPIEVEEMERLSARQDARYRHVSLCALMCVCHGEMRKCDTLMVN